MSDKYKTSLEDALRSVIDLQQEKLERFHREHKWMMELLEEATTNNILHCMFFEGQLGISAEEATEMFSEWYDNQDHDELMEQVKERGDKEDEEEVETQATYTEEEIWKSLEE